MPLNLKVTRPGTVFSVVEDRDITQAQLSIIQSILKADGLTYGEVLAFLAERRIRLNAEAEALAIPAR